MFQSVSFPVFDILYSYRKIADNNRLMCDTFLNFFAKSSSKMQKIYWKDEKFVFHLSGTIPYKNY